MRTIAQRPNAFIDQVRTRPRAQVKILTLANRDHIPTQVVRNSPKIEHQFRCKTNVFTVICRFDQPDACQEAVLDYHSPMTPRPSILKWPVWAAVVIMTVTVLACSPTPAPEQEPASETETLITPAASAVTDIITPEPFHQTVGLTLPVDYEASVVVHDLHGPTQVIMGPDQRLWLTQLAGAENASQGQVVAVSLETGEQQVLLEGLTKPTGLAILADTLWIAAARDLLRAPLNAAGEPDRVETILAELPFNGRSQGTLTVNPAGHLLFETSGRRSGSWASAGSTQLWELDPANPIQPRSIATGLKNAYAHTFDSAGRLWLTDVNDDWVNNDEAPPDELNLWIENADFGWPACFGNQQPALNFDGTEGGCAATRSPVVLFPPNSTPTSVVVSPWEENTLLVALWGQQNQAWSGSR